jgi:hypothetical protein
MRRFVEDLTTHVAPAGTVHLAAGPAVPVYVIIMLIVRSTDMVYLD